MEGVGEGQESTLSTKDFKPTHDLPRTSARSNSIYCNRAPAYQDLRLAGPCTLFNAHNFFFFFTCRLTTAYLQKKEKASSQMKSSPGKGETQHTECVGWHCSLAPRRWEFQFHHLVTLANTMLWLAKICRLHGSSQTWAETRCNAGIVAQAETKELSCEAVIQLICMKSLQEQKIFYSVHPTGALAQRTMASSTEVNARGHWDFKGKPPLSALQTFTSPL